MMTCI